MNNNFDPGNQISFCSQHFVNKRIEMSADDFCLFGFLLDSIEGLATHTRVEGSNILDVFFSPSQSIEFHKFLQAWFEYKASPKQDERFRYGIFVLQASCLRECGKDV